jgi:pSer/pThr/pTyr-binding forkhead associated (FHA) protein
VLKLIIEDDEGRKTVVPFMREEITIGRQEGNTIRLTERNVSRRHARLVRQNGHVLVEDLGSSYGVRVNGDRIAGPAPVDAGDLIQIGDYDLAIQLEEQPAPTVRLEDTSPGLQAVGATQPLPSVPAALAPVTEEHPALGEEPTPDTARRQATAVIRTDLVDTNRKRPLVTLSQGEAPRLVVLNTELAGREFSCTRSELKIGRTDDNDFAIDHRSLSRTHCKVVREETGEWRVIDLQSANGLMVNGEAYSQVTLRPGDLLELGHVRLQFLAPGDPSPRLAPTEATRDTRKLPVRRSLLPALGGLALLGAAGVSFVLFRTPSPSAPASRPGPEARASDPDDQRRQLLQAREAIAALDWSKAEAHLRATRLDTGALTPEAEALLAQLEAERPYRLAIEEAARQLEAGELDLARASLQSAAPTILLAERLGQLEARRVELAAARVGPPRPAAVVAAAPAPAAAPARPDPARARAEEAEALYQESRELVKAQQLEAAVVRLERCVKLATLYPSCYKALGSAHAKIASRDGDEAERMKARKYYERYLELAPPDDKDVAKVRGILEKAAAEQPQ